MSQNSTYKITLWTVFLLLCLSSGLTNLWAQEQRLEDKSFSPSEITVSLDVKDADVRDVLRALARQANVNLAITEAVKGRITIRLENVSWAKALDAVVQTAGLASKREANLITVMAPSDIQRSAERVPEAVELETRVIVFKFANAKAVQNAFKARLSDEGSVTVDEDANTLIISDVPENLENLTALATDIDVVPRQAMINVVIADTTLRNDMDIGVNWEIARTTGHSIFRLSQSLIDTTGEGGTVTYQVLTGKWTTSDFVRALEVVGNSRILASPKILVLSTKTASIATIEEIPYQELTETAQGGLIGTTAFKEAGIKLSVTPKITEDERILLHIFVEQSAATGESVNEVPVISTRKAETTLLLNDGEAVLIGGLRRKDKVKTIKQVPILGDIPLLGFLFKYTSSSVENRELVVFLTPHLFTSSELSNENEQALEEIGSFHKQSQTELEERLHGMERDVEEGNVVGIRRRLSDLRRRLHSPW